jgi:glycerophosphoryl diester phosphodiesterase
MVEFGETPQSHNQPEEVDRSRGILSPRDRRYLLGEADVSSSSQEERNIRAAIRDRLANAILDFSLLFQHMEDRDRRQVFDKLMGERPPSNADFVIMPRGVVHAIALFYLEHRSTEEFESTILDALDQVAHRKGEFRDIEVTIESEPEPDVDQLKCQLEDNELTLRDIGQYYQEGRISFESFLRLLPDDKHSEALSSDE